MGSPDSKAQAHLELPFRKIFGAPHIFKSTLPVFVILTVLCCAVLCCVQWQHPGVMLNMQMQPMGVGGGPMSHGQGMMAQPPSAGQGGGGLVETSSIKPSDAIKADHIITCGELELNVPIGVGAEGKVGLGCGCMEWRGGRGLCLCTAVRGVRQAVSYGACWLVLDRLREVRGMVA